MSSLGEPDTTASGGDGNSASGFISRASVGKGGSVGNSIPGDGGGGRGAGGGGSGCSGGCTGARLGGGLGAGGGGSGCSIGEGIGFGGGGAWKLST